MPQKYYQMAVKAEFVFILHEFSKWIQLVITLEKKDRVSDQEGNIP